MVVVIHERTPSPLCQRRVRQLSLDMFVLMGGEWFTENAQACPSSSS